MLTPDQNRAVQTDSRDVLVIAGAGSGKTRVLSLRVVELLTTHGRSASDLMVLTFTRKAAGEIRERVSNALRERTGEDPERALAGMWLGTFHSVALRILRAHGHLLGYDPETMSVIDADDADMVLESVARDLGYLKGKTWRKGLSGKTLRKWLEMAYTCVGPHLDADTRLVCDRIIHAYHDRLYGMNALDFGLLLRRSLDLVEKFPEVRATIASRIRDVLVDELQDSDEVQFTLHDKFRDATFFGVGDTRQTIYGFRQARPDLMRSQHPTADVIGLRECFRCGDAIVSAANALIAHNGDALAEPMIGKTGQSGLVELVPGRSADVATAIQDRHDTIGYAWGDMAVVCRSHRECKRLAVVFGEAGIPHHRVGSGFDICETPEFKAVLAAMRLVVNGRDELAFIRLWGWIDRPGSFAATIRSYAAEHNCGFFRAIIETGDHPWLADYSPTCSPVALASDAGTELNLAAARRLYIRDFWAYHCSTMTIKDALEWYAQRDSQDDLVAGNRVTISTIHAAKGLEWPLVLIANCNQGTLPSSQSLKAGTVEEERRLMYVGMTRAIERLMIHYRRPCDQGEGRKISDPSMFISEAGINDGLPLGR